MVIALHHHHHHHHSWHVMQSAAAPQIMMARGAPSTSWISLHVCACAIVIKKIDIVTWVKNQILFTASLLVLLPKLDMA
ncbi:hypothetical protein ACJX0J_039302, partial [Zea mays]